eukprot:941306-Pyramimonas_sp.AAC.1
MPVAGGNIRNIASRFLRRLRLQSGFQHTSAFEPFVGAAADSTREAMQFSYSVQGWEKGAAIAMQWYGFSPHVRHILTIGTHHRRVWIVGPRRFQCSLRCRQ